VGAETGEDGGGRNILSGDLKRELTREGNARGG